MTKHKSVTLGVLGRNYAARHAMGQYRSVCVTVTYNILRQDDLGWLSSQNRLDFSLERALQLTIHRHPGLLYGVSDESEAGIPLYRQVHQIDRQDVLNIMSIQDIDSISSDPTEKVADALLSQVLGEGHSQLWPENKPAWKVVVLKHMHASNNPNSGQSSLKRLDITFFVHHAIADGLSGIGFHASFMGFFKRVSGLQDPPSWPMIFDDRRVAPVPIEERVDCLSCDCIICSSPGVCDQKAWGGAPISPAPTLNFKSLVRIVTIPPKELSSVLQKCKQSKITLTGLLHSLICTTLRRSIKEDVPGFRSVTPFSVRRHTGASDRDIVNHVSFLTSYVSRTELDKIHDCEPRAPVEEEHIIDLARSFGKEIVTRVKEFPHGSMVTRQNRIEDMLSHCQNQGGTERQYTYELSNLGSTSEIIAPEDSGLELEKLVFTQCGIVAGPAMAFNCASTKGGPLVIGITWEKGIIEETIMEQVAKELETRLGCGDADDNHQS